MDSNIDDSAGTPEILVVEDSPTQAMELKLTLEQHGFHASIAGNGREALDWLVAQNRPALIISDIMMPQVDGYQLCRAVRGSEKLSGIPVILLSYLSDTADILKGLESGASNFIVKPYDTEYLVSYIREKLSKKQTEERNGEEEAIVLAYGGKDYLVSSNVRQMLDILLATYGTAIRKNEDLVKAETELRLLNEDLEAKVRERTDALTAEIAERRLAEEELRKKTEKLAAYSSRLVTAQEDERNRIANDLHDGICQQLGVIKLNLEMAIQEEQRGKLALSSLEELIPMLTGTLHDIRRVISDLTPLVLDHMGIVPALSQLCREIGKTHENLRIGKNLSVEEHEIPEVLKITIYRISQEALNNAARHSRARSVHVSLQTNDGSVELVIKDDGKGFDVEKTLSKKSAMRGRRIGIASMKERTELSGGDFAIRSSKGEGTRIRACWPIRRFLESHFVGVPVAET